MVGSLGGGGNGREPEPDGDRRFAELDALTDEDLELLVGRVEDEEELRDLIESSGDDEESRSGDDLDERRREERRSHRDDLSDAVPLRLFPNAEYVAAPIPSEGDEENDDAFEPDSARQRRRARIARIGAFLAPAERSLQAAGFYAYGTLDEENRWTIAVDDEDGRADVWLGSDGLVLRLRATSPGLYADVEHPLRRRRLERGAQYALARIARGYLEPHQSAEWDDVDQGIAVAVLYAIPFSHADDVGRIVRRHLPELEDLLSSVERRVTE